MTNTYNADAWLDSIEKPSITINGKTVTGQLLSWQEYLPFAERLGKLHEAWTATETVDTDAYLSFSKDFLAALFPRKKYIVWKPWVVDEIMALPNLQEIVTHFLGVQAKATQSSN